MPVLQSCHDIGRGRIVNTKKAVAELQDWTAAKRQYGLTDAQVQMARELGMKPKRLLQAGSPEPKSLARRIEKLYVRRFERTVPDSVVPVRQLLREAHARERAEAHERRRRKRQAELDHAEAARISLLTPRRICNAIGLAVVDDLSQPDGEPMRDPDAFVHRGLP
jgi:hypothetical protein